jgi:hypothetical protein
LIRQTLWVLMITSTGSTLYRKGGSSVPGKVCG